MTIKRHVATTLLALALAGAAVAQHPGQRPRLVVIITVDQLSGDYLEAFRPYYTDNGLRKLLGEGVVYEDAQYPFSPVDRASAVASVATGASPLDNGITGSMWLDRKSLVPVCCVDDGAYPGVLTKESASPRNLATTTIGDELKVATQGKALIWGIAVQRDAAVLSAGHAADGALWYDERERRWCSSRYYFGKAPKWLETFNSLRKGGHAQGKANSEVTALAIECMRSCALGQDDIPDMLGLTYDARVLDESRPQDTYVDIDREVGKLITAVERTMGGGKALFVLTGTGRGEEAREEADYARYRIPTGTYYANRTANLLNMYLGAIYGQDRYVEGCFYNQVFLSHERIEQKRLLMGEVLGRARSFLIEIAGVGNAHTALDLLTYGEGENLALHNWFNPDRCGDLIIEVKPGWRLLNEDNLQRMGPRPGAMGFPIIFYGGGLVARRVAEPVTTDRIAPTIAKALRIRAPNGALKAPLH